jgi:5-methyltetrahydropteroyltriglutamate--homocysteine methyltransferase
VGAGFTPKVAIPSPTMLHFRAGSAGIPEDVYPTMDEFYADVAAAYRAEVDSLAAAGCRYIQMDDTNLAYLCDDEQRADAAKRGMDPDATTHQYAQLINDSFASAPADMIKAMHLCRGNFRSELGGRRRLRAGGRDHVQRVAIDAFFLEYDDPRSGDFAPLRFLPKGKTVVLGLVTTKLGELETKDDIKRRIDEAAKFAPSTSWRSARSAALPARSTATTSPPSSRPTRSACASRWRRKSGARCARPSRHRGSCR